LVVNDGQTHINEKPSIVQRCDWYRWSLFTGNQLALSREI